MAPSPFSVGAPAVPDAAADARGILHPGAVGRAFDLQRLPAPPPLDRFVDWFWLVSWDLPDGARHEQRVLSHPVVNLSVGTQATEPPTLTGVQRRVSVKRLTGSGRVLGVKFRPGGFRPWCAGPAERLTDRVLLLPGKVAADTTVEPPGDAGERAPGLLRDVAGDLGAALARAARVLSTGAAVADAVDPVVVALSQRVPASRHGCEETLAWAERAAADRSLAHSRDLAGAVGVTVRTLQRRFRADVGVGPKWLLRRYRLYEVAEQARRGPVDWAGLAARLGYADQSHLVRDFTAAVGEPPAQYARHTRGPVPAR